MSDQRLILDSPEAVAIVAGLFPDTVAVCYCNGHVPEEWRNDPDVTVFGRESEWVASSARQLSSPKIRAGNGDISEIDPEHPGDWLRARIQPYTPNPAAQESNSGQAETPPPAPDVPAAAGPSDGPPEWHNEVPDTDIVGPKFVRPKKKPRLRSVSTDGNLAYAPEPDAEPLPASLSEDALAEHFIQTHGAYWRYVPEWKMWLQWRDDGWHRDVLGEVNDYFRRVTREALEWREAQSLTPDGKRKINSKRTAWNARDLAAVNRRLTIRAEELDADPWMLGVPGGVVDLKTGKMLEPDPDNYITRRCSVAPAVGPHPLFDKVLARACAGHDGMREYLLRWFGYMLTGKVNEEAFMFLHGPGGSGKSTLIKCIAEILGDYATTISMDAFTETKNERHPQEIAKLCGARLVYASETEEGRRFKESLIKLLTGGDKITARKMRMDDFEFVPTFKILIYGNSVPHLKGVGEEMRRRIHLVEYAGSLQPEERDSTLKERLILEYPAILATLMISCVDWQDCGGLGKPESVEASVDSYLEGEDNFAEFLSECVEPVTDHTEIASTVYRRYRSWAGANGEYAVSAKRFSKLLQQRGFEPKRTSTARLVSGMRLRPSEQDSGPVPHWQQD